MAVIAFSPLLFIKTRIESSIENTGFQTRGRMYRVIRYTLKHEGLRGFFTGSTLVILKDLPFASIYFTLYVQLLQYWGYVSIGDWIRPRVLGYSTLDRASSLFVVHHGVERNGSFFGPSGRSIDTRNHFVFVKLQYTLNQTMTMPLEGALPPC